MMPRNIRMVLEYDGSSFYGFQIQPQVRTVQGVLTEALRKLTQEDIQVIGAGRTDAGVHALGQVVNFFTASTIPAERFAPALNGILPPDVRVLKSEEVSQDFHARYSALAKTYCYVIYRCRQGGVLKRNYALLYPGKLDVSAMQEAASYARGRHNFKAFCASGSNVRNYVRSIKEFTVSEEGHWLKITVTADGFLYHMVRNLVGTLLEVGSGQRRAEDMVWLLQEGERSQAGVTAPPQGLYLVKIEYPAAYSLDSCQLPIV